MPAYEYVAWQETAYLFRSPANARRLLAESNLANAWSRRITDEHRLVYVVREDDLVLLQVRYHHGR